MGILNKKKLFGLRRTFGSGSHPHAQNRIRFTDMPATLQEKAIRIAEAADKKCSMDKEVASEIQKMIAAEPELGDETAGWHVIVGKSFAASITYNTKFLIFFDLMEC